MLLIDGGKGQLNAARDAFAALHLEPPCLISLAKREEEIFRPGDAEPIRLSRHSAALRLLQYVRDEAHRFAVTFHRQSRGKRYFRSDLDQIPGIGPRRRKALLTAFGSLAGVRRATREELSAVVGAKCAGEVLAYFAGQV